MYYLDGYVGALFDVVRDDVASRILPMHQNTIHLKLSIYLYLYPCTCTSD